MAGESKTSPNRIEAVEKQAQALKLRKAGWTYRAIAEKLGYAAAGGAEKAVKAALHKMLKDDAKDVLVLELARLDDMLRGLYPLAEIGNPMAVDRVLRIMERRASYLGIDAPKKITLEYGLSPEIVNQLAHVIAASGDDVSATFNELIAEYASQHSGTDSESSGASTPAD